MDVQRKYAILFAATILCARKLIEMEPEPNIGNEPCEDSAGLRCPFSLAWQNPVRFDVCKYFRISKYVKSVAAGRIHQVLPRWGRRIVDEAIPPDDCGQCRIYSA